MKKEIIRTERGWGGHFILCYKCLFRRNTLLEYNDLKIVVSTVGLLLSDWNERKFDTVGYDRHFETMAFHADKKDDRFHDIDVGKQIHFDSNWSIAEQDADDRANIMHETVVDEVSNKLLKGYKFEVEED